MVTDATAARPSNTIWLRPQAAFGIAAANTWKSAPRQQQRRAQQDVTATQAWKAASGRYKRGRRRRAALRRLHYNTAQRPDRASHYSPEALHPSN